MRRSRQTKGRERESAEAGQGGVTIAQRDGSRDVSSFVGYLLILLDACLRGYKYGTCLRRRERHRVGVRVICVHQLSFDVSISKY